MIPILSSGGYILKSAKTKIGGNNIEVEIGDEFIGYEKDEYVISARRNGGIRLRFHSAQVWKNRESRPKSEPSLQLFTSAEKARFIRLVYLTRESNADHDMAIIASQDEQALNELTQIVVRRGVCQDLGAATCTLVPRGVAVTPDQHLASLEPASNSGPDQDRSGP